VAKVSAGGAIERSFFLSRAYLSSLPQVSAEVKDDENFPELPLSGMRVSGVDLDVLAKSLDPAHPSDALVAVCRDGYTSPFPRQAMLDHHPILVLTIDGLSPHQWALQHHAYDASPYFVTYQNFVPAFHILAHEDKPQHPAEIVELEIIPSAQLFTAIAPRDADSLPPSSPVLEGYQIAQQNCFRCHNSGETGGTKAERSWQTLGAVARQRPEFFAAWVYNPQAVDPKARMPSNLKYDQATLNALTRYFQTFAP
jgi:mono/diheme cytochrome c family protein